MEETIADAVARLDALAISDREAERRAGLPGGWLSKLRAGKNRDARAADSLAKLRRWLATEKHVGKGMEPVEDRPATEALARALTRSPLPTTAGVDLAASIRTAATFREVKECERELVALALELGDPMPQSLDLAAKVLKSLKDTLKREKDEENSKALNALEILTPDEQAVLAEHRKKTAGPPVQPGEYVRPPETEGGAT